MPISLSFRNLSSEPKGCLPSTGEVDYDPDILFALEEHSPTPIIHLNQL